MTDLRGQSRVDLLRAIDAAKGAISLATLIGESVTLRRRGRLHLGSCPFHGERTASFHVYPDHYHCYGCGAHGDVFDWLRHDRKLEIPDALRFLGGDLAADASPAQTDHQAERARRKARRDAEITAERDKAIGAARQWWRGTMPLAGTIAERYLVETRGIPQPDAGWPDAVRFLPAQEVRFQETAPDGSEAWRSLPASGAVIVGATADDGVLQAVQRIYLDADARNIRREDEKRSKVKLTAGTFAALNGTGAAFVRLPGRADGPILWAEGAETALSVWAATRHETRITLGNISGAVPVPGRRNVICRDDDKPHSAADKLLIAALARWREAGADLVVATPWPERRGDKSDFNDTMQAGGAAAVRARIEAALDRGPPPPMRIPAEEGRELVREAVLRFFAEAQAYDAQHDPANPAAAPASEGPPPATEDEPAAENSDAAAPLGDLNSPPVHLVQIDMGGGKSRRARSVVAQALADMRSRGDTRNIAIAVPTHTLSTEQAQRFEELPEVRAAGLTCRIWRGRERDNPDAPGEKMCRNLELVREVQALKLDAGKKACPVCPHREDCAYLEQNKGEADLWLVAHQMLFEAKPKALGKLAAVVVDESPLAAALEGVERHISLPLDVLARVDRCEGGMLATDRLAFLRRLALDTLTSLPDGALPRTALLAAGFTAASAKEARALEWQTQVEVELHPDMTVPELREALDAARLNADLGRRVWWWRALHALLEPGGPESSGWAAIGTEDTTGGQGDQPARFITLKGRRAVSLRWQIPTLLLDATARPELLRFIWPALRSTADVRLQAPHQHIRQAADCANALSRLDVAGAHDDAERHHRERNLSRVHAIICREARLHAGRVLVVVQQRIEEALREVGNLPGNLELAHHNGVRGRDEWGEVAALVVVGRTMPPSGSIARMTEALTSQAMPVRSYERVAAWREQADGTAQACEALAYPDPIGEALRWQTCEAEVVQIIGRARGVNRTAGNPVDVLVLTDTPLPLPVELIPAASLEPSPDYRMLAAGGVVLMNCTDIATAYPGLWRNRETAKSALRKWRLGDSPYKNNILIRDLTQPLMRVEYQRSGAGRSVAEAWYDPSIVPDVVGWLFEQLGDLSDWDVGPFQDAGAGVAENSAAEASGSVADPSAETAQRCESTEDRNSARGQRAAIEVPGGYGEALAPVDLFPSTIGPSTADELFAAFRLTPPACLPAAPEP